jgi:hypothetical protein
LGIAISPLNWLWAFDFGLWLWNRGKDYSTRINADLEEGLKHGKMEGGKNFEFSILDFGLEEGINLQGGYGHSYSSAGWENVRKSEAMILIPPLPPYRSI